MNITFTEHFLHPYLDPVNNVYKTTERDRSYISKDTLCIPDLSLNQTHGMLSLHDTNPTLVH